MDYTPTSAWDIKLKEFERSQGTTPWFSTGAPSTGYVTSPKLTVAEKIDPGMVPRSRGMAADHRGRSVNAGKRTTQVSRDPYVQHLATRKPTIPSIISRQGVKDTASRNAIGLGGAAAGYLLGTGAGGDSAEGFGVLADVPAGLKGAITGAAIGYGLTKLGKRMGDD
jgi:hypothetical protein